jgi:hypothetical protein
MDDTMGLPLENLSRKKVTYLDTIGLDLSRFLQMKEESVRFRMNKPYFVEIYLTTDYLFLLTMM